MADDPQLLTDIRLDLRHSALRPVYVVATTARRVSTRQGGHRVLTDLATVSGRDNLGQAIMMRLLTPRGELAALGHPEYGSRLHELIGRQNTATTRNLARLFILEAVQLERRVEKMLKLEVAPAPGARDRIEVRLSVKPIGATTALDLGPFALQL
jgi:phage baseplate assembly protein W